MKTPVKLALLASVVTFAASAPMAQQATAPKARYNMDVGTMTGMGAMGGGMAQSLRRAGHVLPQADIIEHLYELDELRDRNTVEVLIGRLRRKVGAQRITTQRGLGYRFEK